MYYFALITILRIPWFLCVGDDKPSIRLLNIHVRDKVAPKWFDLGLQLLSSGQLEKLDTIRKDNPADTNMCCTEMFKLWLNVDIEASWNKLIAALEQIGHNALGEIIRSNILKGFYIIFNLIVQLINCIILYRNSKTLKSTTAPSPIR